MKEIANSLFVLAFYKEIKDGSVANVISTFEKRAVYLASAREPAPENSVRKAKCGI